MKENNRKIRKCSFLTHPRMRVWQRPVHVINRLYKLCCFLEGRVVCYVHETSVILFCSCRFDLLAHMWSLAHLEDQVDKENDEKLRVRMREKIGEWEKLRKRFFFSCPPGAVSLATSLTPIFSLIKRRRLCMLCVHDLNISCSNMFNGKYLH